MDERSGTQHLLFVDDDSRVHKGVNRLFRQRRVPWNYTFTKGVDEALGVLAKQPVDVVLSDISMPERSGFELLAEMRCDDRWQDVPIIMLTGLGEAGLKSRALDLGATDLLNKPVDSDELLARIRSVMQIKRYQDEIRMHNRYLNKMVDQRTRALEAARVDMVWRLAKAAEFRNAETGNHVVRVSHYSEVLAEGLGLDTETRKLLFVASPLHDIGKIGIPDRILLKNGKLTAEEWKVMEAHCRIGQDLLGREMSQKGSFPDWATDISRMTLELENPFLVMAAEIAGCHHEQWSGGGYPYGLQGSRIPLAARIVTLADVYDALRSKRPYKDAFSHEDAIAIMSSEQGTRFDPTIFAIFEQNAPRFLEISLDYLDDQN